MKRLSLLAVILASLALLLAGMLVIQAEDPQPQAPPPPVRNTVPFSYQGRLLENGQPANGRYDFDATIWDDISTGDKIADCNAATNVEVNNGIFQITVYPVGTASGLFDGSGRFLELQVRKTGETTYSTMPRQTIRVAPYAWGLMPGAKMTGDSDLRPVLEITDSDADTSHAALKVDGDVEITGALKGTFPSPAYDSSWVAIGNNETKTLTHGLGGNVDDYVVDCTFKSTNASYGVNQLFYGGNSRETADYGAYWRALSTISIQVKRFDSDGYVQYIRVRIWVIN
jgi:hypothetical protein